MNTNSESPVTSNDSSPTVPARFVDAVFVIGTGSKNNNEELKYALRNLERNCPFVRNVYISGECPDWVDTAIVKHLPWPDRFNHAKDANIIDKLRHACEQSDIAENILFCSDDQFQTRVCSWEDFSPRWLRKYEPDDKWYAQRKRIWHTRLRNTLERDRIRREKSGLSTGEVYYYQPHMWMQINRDKFIEYAKWSGYETRDDTIIASGYFNFISAGGKNNYDHIFISSNQSWPVTETHIAYTDSSYTAAMAYLRKTFNSRSRFEVNTAEPRPDEDIITDIKGKISSNPVWSNLLEDVKDAEMLRERHIQGWKKVWNDIIHRWSSATDKGARIVPVSQQRGVDAESVISNNRMLLGKPTSSTQPRHSTCSKCEERRRMLREQEQREQAQREQTQQEQKKVEHKDETRSADANIPSKTAFQDIPSTEGCMDCAIEHLATAIAYLSSNAVRPTPFSVELARGEVRVSAQHLLALHKSKEYNKCTEILDSVYTEKSTFSASSLKDLLRMVLDGRSQ